MESIKELFSRRDDVHLNVSCYIYDPETMGEMKRLLYWDENAADHIRECEEMIETLKAYRKALADRANVLEHMAYTDTLELLRLREFSTHKVRYTISIDRKFADNTAAPILSETYQGSDRRKALARFEQLKKERPGIVTKVDIEKRAWER